MKSPDETRTPVELALQEAKAHEPEPPAWFVATVMRRVEAWQGTRSAWTRWRRAARAANFSPAPRVGMAGVSIQAGGMVMKKMVWTVAALGALAIAAYVWLGYPPVGQGTDATIGAAQRYQAQPAPTAAPVADTSVQAFMQTDTFDRIMKNADTRHLLEKAAADPGLRGSLSNQQVMAAFGQREFVEALARQEFRKAVSDAAMLRSIAEAALQRNVAEAAMARGINDANLVRLLNEPALAEALRTSSMQEAMRNADFVKAMASREMQSALTDAAVLRALTDASMIKAMHEVGFQRGLAQDAFASNLRR